MIGRILLTLAFLAVAGLVLLVLIGLWDPYEQGTGALGFRGTYERYLASQAGFVDDPKAYRAVVEAEHTRTAGVGSRNDVQQPAQGLAVSKPTRSSLTAAAIKRIA